MSGTEQLFESDDDAYDEFDYENNDEENEGIVVKEEDDSETDYDALENGDQPAGNELEIKTEEQDETSIDMYDYEFYLIMEKDFGATAENVNEVSGNEESKNDSDATEIDDEDYEAVSELQQTEAVVNGRSSSSSSEQQLSRRQREIKNHRCQQCNKSFDFPSNLKIHQRVHTSDRPYKCTVCSKSFTQTSDLKRHQLLHTGDRPYKCTVCSKSFALIGNLKQHQRVHTGDRPYKCTVCSKSFTQANDLKRHQRVHTSDRPYKCTVCSKSFTQLDTNWCTLTPDHFNAPFVSKRLNGNNLSNGTFKPSILSKTTLPASFHKINI
ncbi:hypothetical protein TYRP_009001 [Tyrophagus putrescentiae]|nr:hypothetical protein TYRP_009001 [Tyrophagus putrescentiae]